MLRCQYENRWPQVVQGSFLNLSRRWLTVTNGLTIDLNSQIYELGLISGTVYTGKWANGLLMASLK